MPLLRSLSSRLGRKQEKPAVDERQSTNGSLGSIARQTSSNDNGRTPTGDTDIEYRRGENLAPDLGAHGSPDTGSALHMPNRANSSSNERPSPATATRKDVENTFEKFAQLIHASRRPLPTQTGDGQYIGRETTTGVLGDLKAMRMRDIKTVKHILSDKASGLPQDDRKMHMEEVCLV